VKKSVRSKNKSSTAPVGAQPAFLFDMDGTLIDSVYEHTLAWREAFEKKSITVPMWLIHRRIGMSGGLLAGALLRDGGRRSDEKVIEQLENLQSQAFKKGWAQVRPLPGARDLLMTLSRLQVRWAIATSGSQQDARKALKLLRLGSDISLVTRDDVHAAKPDPDLFLAAAKKLNANLEDCVVVGDSVWDLLAARRAKALGIGLLSGGFGEEELMDAGAYRVYQDPGDMLNHLDEIGIRINS
jgi:HAD superfamily hydrolase (TIGR01509 family)